VFCVRCLPIRLPFGFATFLSGVRFQTIAARDMREPLAVYAVEDHEALCNVV
jgi:hypothetical protein